MALEEQIIAEVGELTPDMEAQLKRTCEKHRKQYLNKSEEELKTEIYFVMTGNFAPLMPGGYVRNHDLRKKADEKPEPFSLAETDDPIYSRSPKFLGQTFREFYDTVDQALVDAGMDKELLELIEQEGFNYLMRNKEQVARPMFDAVRRLRLMSYSCVDITR
jgi:hypothetical protein